MKYAVKYIKNTFYPLSVPDTLTLEEGQLVLVRTEKGEEALKVELVNEDISRCWEESKNKPEPLPVIRTLTQRDIQTLEDIKKEEVESFFKCQALVKQHGLVMNLVQCIGVRDETSLVDGVGLCGRPFCCSSFLRKFATINVKLAKDQGMPIAPGKISGTCGRLLCCLTYEYENYIDAAKGMPPIGASVMTSEGLGKVCYLNFMSGTVSVKMEDGKTREVPKTDIEIVDADVNVEIDVPVINNAYDEEGATAQDIKQLEDDRNSSTGNV